MAADNTRYVKCQCCHEYRFDLEWEYCRSCGAVSLAPVRHEWDGNEIVTCLHPSDEPCEL